MRGRFQFAAFLCLCRSALRALPIVFAAMILVLPAATRAQNSSPQVIGRVEGDDISCQDGTPQTGGTSSEGTSLDVSDGTVVTVHSGQARLTLVVGGVVDVCGPAKLTVLLSGDAITLALNFGRVRVQLPESTALRIFTPTIIGTPLDIAGGARDVTVGLSLDDSLCVTATSGAIQLEHQFTGEKLIVPQAGEFFLNLGKLLPVAGTPGSCKCTAAPVPAPTRTASPDYAAAPAPPVIKQLPPIAIIPAPPSAAAPVPAPAAASVDVEPAPENQVTQYSRLAEANEAHPVVGPARDAAPAPPPTTNPLYTAQLPPLTFMAGSPLPPPAPTADMVILIREARVAPEWEFSGRVEAPEFAKAMQNALGEKRGPDAGASNENGPEAKPKKKGGFWAALRRAFGGGSGG
jgi:hypothetical protein